MNTNILIIGNGFDLYHDLPTKYIDFLSFAKNWSSFYSTYQDGQHNYQQGLTKRKITNWDPDNMSYFADYYHSDINEKNVTYLEKNLNRNLWIQFFNSINYEKEGWIDFEQEIEAALFEIEQLFELDFRDTNGKDFYQEQRNLAVKFTPIEKHKDYYSGFYGDRNENTVYSQVCVKTKKAKRELKELIIKTMHSELDSLKECFKIYLKEFVNRLPIQKNPFFEKIKINKVLNFNYTDTYKRIYEEENQKIDEIHIHGDIDNNNMVLGIRDDFMESQSLDYIKFSKYYQRIVFKLPGNLKEWSTFIDTSGVFISPKIYVFGHSLDKTDKGILDYFLNSKDDYQIIILYVAKYGFGQQVKNLVDMFGRETIISKVATGIIEFKDISTI